MIAYEDHQIFKEFVDECFDLFQPEYEFSSKSFDSYKISLADVYQAWSDWTQKGNNGWKYIAVMRIQPKSSDGKKFFAWLQNYNTYVKLHEKLTIRGKCRKGFTGMKLAN